MAPARAGAVDREPEGGETVTPGRLSLWLRERRPDPIDEGTRLTLVAGVAVRPARGLIMQFAKLS